MEWAATVISCLREDELFSHMNCSNGPGVEHLKEKPFVTDSIDQLLTYYALQALEFPPPVILTPQDACMCVCVRVHAWMRACVGGCH